MGQKGDTKKDEEFRLREFRTLLCKGGWGRGNAGKKHGCTIVRGGGGAGVLLQRMLAEKCQGANLLRNVLLKKSRRNSGLKLGPGPSTGAQSGSKRFCSGIWPHQVYLLGQPTPPTGRERSERGGGGLSYLGKRTRKGAKSAQQCSEAKGGEGTGLVTGM